MPAKTTRPAKSAAPAVYSAQQVQTIFAAAEAANAKIHASLNETISDFKAIMEQQDHQLMQFRGLTALAKAQGSL
jgi:hypothetical protein